jgi:hypothetical protein
MVRTTWMNQAYGVLPHTLACQGRIFLYRRAPQARLRTSLHTALSPFTTLSTCDLHPTLKCRSTSPRRSGSSSAKSPRDRSLGRSPLPSRKERTLICYPYRSPPRRRVSYIWPPKNPDRTSTMDSRSTSGLILGITPSKIEGSGRWAGD